MEVDDSFKKPGAIPFKWEIRPGVPKLQKSQNLQENASSSRKQQQQQKMKKQTLEDEEFSFSQTPTRLAPPPAGYCFQPPIVSRTGSFRSSPHSLSDRFRYYSSNLAQPISVSSSGCFPSPLLIKKGHKYKSKKPKTKGELEPEIYSASDLDTLSRSSVSSWKSLSPFRDSPLYPPFSSYQFTPPRRVANDAEWAGFGLF